MLKLSMLLFSVRRISLAASRGDSCVFGFMFPQAILYLVSSFKLNAARSCTHGEERKRRVDKKRLIIAFPASVILDTPHLREKTAKVGLIGRAAAIFRVDEIIIYPDNPKSDQRRDMDFIALLLNYL